MSSVTPWCPTMARSSRPWRPSSCRTGSRCGTCWMGNICKNMRLCCVAQSLFFFVCCEGAMEGVVESLGRWRYTLFLKWWILYEKILSLTGNLIQRWLILRIMYEKNLLQIWKPHTLSQILRILYEKFLYPRPKIYTSISLREFNVWTISYIKLSISSTVWCHAQMSVQEVAP